MHGLVYRLRGGPRRATLTGLGLSDLMFDSDYNPAVRAGIPAAVRAALDHGDPAPLLRLAHSAEGLASLPGPREFSAARYAAVCEETPLPWPRSTPFGAREGLARRRRTGWARARSSRSATRRRARTRSTSACTGPTRRRRRCSAARTRRCRR